MVIGDADAHGKNISLLHPVPGRVTLAPVYDCVPTALWPRLRATAAMRINGLDVLGDVTAEDLIREARRWGLGTSTAAAVVADVGERLRAAMTGLPVRGPLDLAALVGRNVHRVTRR